MNDNEEEEEYVNKGVRVQKDARERTRETETKPDKRIKKA